MVAASKHVRFNELCSELDCKEVYHSWTPSCLASVWDINQRSMKGSVQLFTSMYMLQLILCRREVNREYLKRHAKNCVRSILFGNLLSTFSVALCCTIRRLLGRFYHYTTLFLPAMLGASALLLERREKQELYVCAFFTMTLEYVVRHLVRADRLQLTKLRMCASFMLLNTAAMYLMRSNSSEMSSGINYWFFIPPRVENRSCKRREDSEQTDCKNSVCNHSGSCWSHTFQESTKYLGLGMTVQVLRVLLSQFRRAVVHPAEQLQNLCLRKKLLPRHVLRRLRRNIPCCGLPAVPAPWSRLGGSRSASWLSRRVCLLVLSQVNHITHGGHYSPSAANKARHSSRHCAPLRLAYEQHICDSFRGYVSLPNSGRGNMSPRLH